MKDSKDFKQDVIELYATGCTATEIAHKLAKKYKVDVNGIGRAFVNFKARVSMCILRYKRWQQNTRPVYPRLHI